MIEATDRQRATFESTSTAASGGAARKFLERHAIPGTDRELVMVEVTLPPGGAAPLHRHPVAGLVYILEGTAESAYGDDPPRRYETGGTLQDRPDIPHTIFRNVDPRRPLRFLVSYVIEPGQSYVVEL